MSERVTLKLDGQLYETWTAINIRRGLNSLCSSFSLNLTTDRSQEVQAVEVTDGISCQLWVGDELFLDGWVGSVDRNFDAGNHSITVSGRDKTGDLIDCSAVHKPGSWKNVKLEKIAADLIKPFGLTVRVEADTGAAFPAFALEQGEDVFSAVTRLCRLRGVMLGTAADGTLLIFKPSTAKTAIVFEQGVNILKAGFTTSTDERFSDYIVKGQHQGGDYVQPKAAAAPKSTATDAGVKRYRPLIIVNDDQSSAKGLAARAAWEATTRMARSQGVSVVIQGWRDNTGKLLAPNQLCQAKIPYILVDRELMIAEVEFNLSDQGTTANVTLVRPEAYTIEVIPEPKPKKRKGKTKATADDSDFAGKSQ